MNEVVPGEISSHRTSEKTSQVIAHDSRRVTQTKGYCAGHSLWTLNKHLLPPSKPLLVVAFVPNFRQTLRSTLLLDSRGRGQHLDTATPVPQGHGGATGTALVQRIL